MLSSEQLKEALHASERSRREQLLLCMSLTPLTPVSPSEIKERAKAHGVRGSGNWNISATLSASAGDVIKTDAGWELTTAAKAKVAAIANVDSPIRRTSTSLRKSLAKISNVNTLSFVEEAIACFEGQQFRAAVVLSWVGAVSALYDHVVATKLAQFNVEAARRDSRWKPASDSDGLSRMGEYDFLQVIESIHVIGRNVKQDLESALKLRNACGHPNSLVVAENKAAAHVESLALNVFAKFP